MNITRLSIASLRHNRISNLFNVAILALGIAIIVTLLSVSEQVEKRFERDLQGIDLVVGAKGSPLQLILSAVFHVDAPTGNIPLAEAEKLKTSPLVQSSVPLALGDNYNGFRIVGTSEAYITHYHASLAQGKLFEKPMEVVIGSEVAKKYALKTGDKIIGAHGLNSSDDLHKDFPYTVTGILGMSGTVLDHLVLTQVASVWQVHDHPDADEAAEEAVKKPHGKKPEAKPEKEREITALLVTYKSPLAAATLPRLVNKTSSLQAASPALEMARLLKMLGIGSDIIRIFAVALVIIAAAGFFMTLFNAVKDRSYEIALLRILGATRGKIFAFIVSEGLILGIAGTVIGVILGHILSFLVGNWIAFSKNITLETGAFSLPELFLVAAALLISIIASMIPAFMAYRVNVVRVISRNV